MSARPTRRAASSSLAARHAAAGACQGVWLSSQPPMTSPHLPEQTGPFGGVCARLCAGLAVGGALEEAEGGGEGGPRTNTYSLLCSPRALAHTTPCTAQPCRGRLLGGRGAADSPPGGRCRPTAPLVASRGLFGYESGGREPQIVLLFRSRRIGREHSPHHASTSLLHDTTSEYLSVINHTNDIPSPIIVVCTTTMGPCRYFCVKTVIMGIVHGPYIYFGPLVNFSLLTTSMTVTEIYNGRSIKPLGERPGCNT